MRADRFYVMRPIGKRAIPDLQAGPARIVVHAARPVLRGLRTASNPRRRATCRSGSSRRRSSVLSTFHYVNLGGAEFVVYRATPADVESGVRVGDRTLSRLSRHRDRHHERPGAARRVLRAVAATRT